MRIQIPWGWLKGPVIRVKPEYITRQGNRAVQRPEGRRQLKGQGGLVRRRMRRSRHCLQSSSAGWGHE